MFSGFLRYFGACLKTPNLAMVMEFMPDGCLYELLHVKDDIQLTDEVKKSMIRQLAGGLAYLHHDVSKTGLFFVSCLKKNPGQFWAKNSWL